MTFCGVWIALSTTHPIHHPRLKCRASRMGLTCARAENTVNNTQCQPTIIAPKISTRPAAPAPQLAPIQRSSAFLLQHRRKLEDSDSEETNHAVSKIVEEPFSGSAVEWMLRKADESLDEIESNPPSYAKAIYKISTGPIGTAATKSVLAAAEMTGKVGKEAIKAAVPAGKWAVQQGFKLMVGAVVKGVSNKGKNLDNTKSR